MNRGLPCGWIALTTSSTGRYKAPPMASNTKATTVKRKNKHEKMGRRRKNKLAKKSTQSTSELFAGLGEPGSPAPAR